MTLPRTSTLIQKSPEVFLAQGPIAAVGRAEIDILKAAVEASPKRRARINAHPDGEDTLHEMIIAIDASSYIRPHKHPGKNVLGNGARLPRDLLAALEHDHRRNSADVESAGGALGQIGVELRDERPALLVA